MPRPLTIAFATTGFAAALVVGIVMIVSGSKQSPAPLEAQDPGAVAPTVLPAGGAKVRAASPPSRVPSGPTPGPSVPKPREPAEPAAKVAPPVDEAPLMEKLRALGATDPALTIALARDGNKRFPDSAEAPERAWMVVKSLTNLEKFKDAHDEAEVMVKQYPGTSWALDVQRHLLSNPLDSGGGGP